MISALRAAIMAGAGALLSGGDATERSKSFGPNLFKASGLLFCKRAPKGYCPVHQDRATVEASLGGVRFRLTT